MILSPVHSPLATVMLYHCNISCILRRQLVYRVAAVWLTCCTIVTFHTLLCTQFVTMQLQFDWQVGWRYSIPYMRCMQLVYSLINRLYHSNIPHCMYTQSYNTAADWLTGCTYNCNILYILTQNVFNVKQFNWWVVVLLLGKFKFAHS